MTQRELTPADYKRAFRRHLVMIVVMALGGGLLAYGISWILPTSYKSQTTVLVQEPTVPSDIVKPVDTTDIGQRLSSMKQQILSRSRLEPVIRQFGLYPKDIDRQPMDILVAKLAKDIDVSPMLPMEGTRAENMPGFNVTVTQGDARTAQEVCTAVTSLFIEESLQLRQRHSEDTTQFLSQRLADAKANLDAQDGKLATFETRYMGALPDEEQTNLNLLTNLTSQLDAATQALARAQQDKSFTEAVLTQQVAAWQSTQGGNSPDTLETQLAALQTQLTDLQARYTDDYPDVIKTKNNIAALKDKIAEGDKAKSASGDKTPRATLEPAQITQLRAQIHSYEQVIAEKSKEEEGIKEQIRTYQGRVQSSPVVEEQYKELTRGYQTALESYNDLLKKRDESAMATSLEQEQEGEQFRVLDAANLPDEPSFPNRLVFAAGGFGGGLGLSLTIAFFLEMRNTSLLTEKDVEQVLHLPVLAMIPTIEPTSGKNGKPVSYPKHMHPETTGARS
jgi:polysaccharide chain length determinant protein (PEP-CTERM system associated)